MTRTQHAQKNRHKVLIIGGYGTFGGRVARLLADEPRLLLLIAGRNLHKAEAFIEHYQQRAQMLPVDFDRDNDVQQQLTRISPDCVIDASGPFQAYGHDTYRVVEAAIACGTHYLDLADASDFVCGIEKFDASAAQANVFVLSGASTCPTLTSAVCRRLVRGLATVKSVSCGVAPSPYAGVGLSVMGAIAHSAGQPVPIIKDNCVITGYPFTDARRFTIAPPGHLPLHRRTFSLVDLPDLRLLRTVEPKTENTWLGAAPVPAIYHATLRVLARAVKRGWLSSVSSLASLMAFTMNHLAWGEHRGGMFVEVRGEDSSGHNVKRSWQLVAEGGDGPSIPSIASAAVILQWLDGRMPAPGARPAIHELELEDFDCFFGHMNIHIGNRDEPVPDEWPVFRKVLGDAWDKLPSQIRELHDIEEGARFSGRATVTSGKSMLARLIGKVIGFPPDVKDVPVEVTMLRKDGREYWSRDFDGHKFSSVMTAGSGRFSHLVCEKFGPVRFAMALVLEDGRLHYVHRGWTFLGIPMPRFLGPQGDTCESVEEGRFHFQVEIKLPIVGHIVTYDGWLTGNSDFD